jgi:hypothetical protein
VANNNSNNNNNKKIKYDWHAKAARPAKRGKRNKKYVGKLKRGALD